MGLIYCIENTINNKKYVGQTQNKLSIRWCQHKWTCKNRSDINYPLYVSMRKHGIENFNIYILEETDNKLLNEREKYWIDYYDTFKNGYNATLGGDGREVKVYNEEEIVSLFNSGVNRAQIAELLSIDRHTVSRILENHGFFFKHERGVNMYTLDGKYEQSFDSLAQASLFCCGKDNQGGNISLVCQGIRRYALGHRWTYDIDLIENIGLLEESINMYDLDGNFEANFVDSGFALDFIKEEGYLNATHSGILDACKKGVSAYKHQWKRGVLNTLNIEPISSSQLKGSRNAVNAITKDGESIGFRSVRQAALFLCETGDKSKSTYERNIKKYCNKDEMYEGYYWKGE